MRLIDADALDLTVKTLMKRYISLGATKAAEDYNFVLTVISTAETIDAVEVVHGRWEQRESGFVYFCSNCEYWTFQREAHEWHYCPNCGTQMDGIEHE